MPDTRTLNDLAGSGVALQPHEAVAIVQQLMAAPQATHELTPPPGPPSLDNVQIRRDGSVIYPAGASTPAVFELAILLEAMLPRATTPRVPGGLRYTIARALHEVDAPPFDSIADLSAALVRFEKGDRTAVVRELFARAAPVSPVVAIFPGDRRRSGRSATELRRQLRDADELLFAYAAALETGRELPVPGLARRRPFAWVAGATVAAMLAFGIGYTAVRQLNPASSNPPGTVTQASASAASPVAARPIDAPEGALASTSRPANPEVRASSPQPRVPRDVETGVPEAAEPRVMRAVSTSEGPTFSPSFGSNGTALFFHTGRSSDPHSALEAADLAGPELRVMTIVDDGSRNYHVQPSPDGTRVAFDSDRDGERGVYIAARDGTGVRRVSGSGYAAVPTWSPDSQSIAFVRGEADRPQVWNLWLLTLETGAMRRLTSFRYGQTWGGSWFSDGRRISYTHEDTLAILDLQTGATRQFPSPIKGRLVRTPAVSPDGQHVIFQVAKSGAWLLDLRDGSMRSVLDDPTAEEFAWSPDGRRVAFHSRRDGQWGIWFMAST
jgi:hypothetical protein